MNERDQQHDTTNMLSKIYHNAADITNMWTSYTVKPLNKGHTGEDINPAVASL